MSFILRDYQAEMIRAARWSSDQDFINRVICGHSGRLSVDEVRAIRALGEFDMSSGEIGARMGIEKTKVRNVIAGRRYGRVE